MVSVAYVTKGAGTERADTDGDVLCMQVCWVVSVAYVTKGAGTELSLIHI